MVYLHNDREQFREAIYLSYQQTGIMAQAIEKDYYVTLLLQILAQEMPYIVFKGGTSLSKCHKVIQRFSEDIDITIDTLLSQGQKRKAKQIILDAAAELGLVIDNLDEIRSRRDYNRYVLSYNSVIPMASDALKPAVLLETSYTAVSFPTVLLPVHSYVGDMMQNEVPNLVDEYHLSPFEMKVALWTDICTLEKKLNVSFDPSAPMPQEDLEFLYQLRACLLCHKKIAWKHPFSKLHLTQTSQSIHEIESLVGKDDISLNFDEGPISCTLLGTSFELYSKTELRHILITSIDWTDDNKSSADLYIADSSSRSWELLRAFVTTDEYLNNSSRHKLASS